ncbi:GumC family protein [Mangrovibacterium diazotrophicum]|uniref:non-specific protein-tyrosine kinase n=1 Tax=Mangrovibacterium diazotrophicum TaxID=1261403 RepID=A0A419W952_9BACT|nr:polysaccharide biosynthesis tyrosine autokinase [Mangrovibacterium diazotrophicum]RKD92007.1 capsular exopolysaccharide synthesis family protein [Mangrovibacterium diazotrophicum]
MERNDMHVKPNAYREEEPLNFKELILKLLQYWYWFVISTVVCGSIAVAYMLYVPSTYETNSILLVKEQNNSSLSLDNLFGKSPLKSDVKLENHIGILTSFSLNYQVLANLGWLTSWYREMPFGDYSMYKAEPYKVTFAKDAFNLKGVPIHISILDDNHYKIVVNSETKILGIDTDISFEKKGVFGEKFENQYFSFTIQKALVPKEGNYYFMFNNWDKMTLVNLEKLKINNATKGADLITIKYSGQTPDQCITYVNELCQVYIQYGLKQKNQISENTIQFIDHQLKDIVDTLKSTSNQFTEYRSNKKVFDLGTEASLVAEKLSDLDSKRSMAKMQLEYYQNLLKYIDKEGDMGNMVIPSVVGITDQGLNSMVVRLSELNSKKEALSYSLHSKNPSVQVIDKELDYLRKSLQENLNNLVFNTTNELKSIDQDISEVNEQLSRYPQTEQDLINIKRMVDLNNELYNFLLQKRAEAQITKASNVPDVDVLDPARWATTEKIGPKKKIILGVALVLGLAIPFLIIMLKDFFDETVEDKQQIEKLTGLTVISDIMHSSYKEPLPIIGRPRSVLAESFRELRTGIEYLNFESENRVIGIHSMVPGEGKSFVSSNLASIIALNDMKVVLIGADMRKPTLHNYFGMNNAVGLSTYLIGHHTLDDIIKPTKLKNMDVITAGDIPPNPVELLASKKFKELIEELKTRYDLIMIDNSPLTLVTDGAVVAKYTNSNLFVVRHKYSTKGSMEMLQQIVKKNKIPKPGIVLNDINPKKLGSYAHRNGGYYRKAYGEGTGYFDDSSKKK